MLGTVQGKPFGMLSVTPRDAAGKAIDMDRIEDYIIYDAEGNEVKEWYAIASYLQTMGGELDERYAATDGRKVVYRSYAPADLLRNANQFTYIVLAAGLLVILIVVLIVRVVRASNRRNLKLKRKRGYKGR
jgi:hypothetical protein